MPVLLLLFLAVLLAIVWVALLYDYSQHRHYEFDYRVTYVEHDDDEP